jgi:hypothetical protein
LNKNESEAEVQMNFCLFFDILSLRKILGGKEMQDKKMIVAPNKLAEIFSGLMNENEKIVYDEKYRIEFFQENGKEMKKKLNPDVLVDEENIQVIRFVETDQVDLMINDYGRTDYTKLSEVPQEILHTNSIAEELRSKINSLKEAQMLLQKILVTEESEARHGK